MRTKRGRTLGLLLAATSGILGCGQLWRPFLQGVEPIASCNKDDDEVPGCDPACDPLCPGAADLSLSEWEVVPTQVTTSLRAIWGRSDEGVIYLGGDDDTLLSWESAKGVTSLGHPATGAAITALTGDPKGGLPVFATGTGNLLLQWDGRNWLQRVPGKPADTYLAVAYTGTAVWVTGKAGVAYNGPPSGTYNLAFIPGGSAVTLRAAWPIDSSQIWIGTDQALYRSYGGNTFSYGIGGTDAVTAIWSTGLATQPCDLGSCAVYYATTDAGRILHFDGAGAVTTDYEGSGLGQQAHTALWGNTLGDIWVVGRAGTVLHGDGKTWTAVDVGTTEDLLGIWVAPTSKKPWIVGAKGLLMRRRSINQ